MLKFIDDHANAISALGSVTSAMAALVALFIAWKAAQLSKKLLDENRLLRLAGSDPEVVVYLQPSQQSLNVLTLVIENVGSGPAFNVKLNTNLDQNILSEKGAFFQTKFGEIPITAITPNNKIITLFGIGFRLLGETPIEPFKCNVSYNSLRKEVYNREFIIDVKQFAYMGRLNNDPVSDIAKHLNKISTSLEAAVDFDHIKVVTSTPAERAKEQQQIFKDMEASEEQKAPEVASYQMLASKWLRRFRVDR